MYQSMKVISTNRNKFNKSGSNRLLVLLYLFNNNYNIEQRKRKNGDILMKLDTQKFLIWIFLLFWKAFSLFHFKSMLIIKFMNHFRLINLNPIYIIFNAWNINLKLIISYQFTHTSIYWFSIDYIITWILITIYLCVSQ